MRTQLGVTILDSFGEPVAGAQVTVKQRGTSTLAAIYQDFSSVTQLPNPVYTDTYGRAPGWLERGGYDLEVSHRSIAPFTVSVDSAPARDGSIDTGWIADGAVTAAKLNANVTTTPAAGSVGTTQLANGAVTDAKVNDVSGSKLAALSVPTGAIADGAITTAKLAALAVTDAKVNDVSGSKIAAASIPGSKLQNLAVGTAQIADQAVTGAKIANGAVGTTQIADGSVTSAKLASGAAAPTGAVLTYAGSVAPAGFVLCDGATYNGTDPTYTPLWNIIGTTYGGTGQSAFKVPDIQGRVVVGRGPHTDVATLGNNDGVAAASRRPKHTHTLTDSTGGWLSNALTGIPLENNAGNAHLTAGAAAMTGVLTVGPAGSPTDAPAYIVLSWIIKL